jgi:hypothetical protein
MAWDPYAQLSTKDARDTEPSALVAPKVQHGCATPGQTNGPLALQLKNTPWFAHLNGFRVAQRGVNYPQGQF